MHDAIMGSRSLDGSSDDVDDQTERTDEAYTLSVEKINQLNDDLKRLYASMDAGDGTLEDVHLIP